MPHHCFICLLFPSLLGHSEEAHAGASIDAHLVGDRPEGAL